MAERSADDTRTQAPLKEDAEEKRFLQHVGRRLQSLVVKSRLALFCESLARAAFSPALVLSAFLGLTFLNVWSYLPGWWRFAAFAVFAGIFIVSLRSFYQLRWPSREEALARLEGDGQPVTHRPLTAFEDSLSKGDEDPLTASLWSLHRKRMAAAVETMPVKWPNPRIYRVDPYGLRVVAVALLLIGVIAGSGERMTRLGTVFSSPFVSTTAPMRLDAWVTPPLYTDNPPVFLTGENAKLRDPNMPIGVPEGSILVVRSLGHGDLQVRGAGSALEAEAQSPDGLAPPSTVSLGSASGSGEGKSSEQRFKLMQATVVELVSDEEVLGSWSFDVMPDDPPVIALVNDPEPQLSGALKLTYSIEDDYGAVAAEAHIRATENTGAKTDNPRPLVEAPDFPLSLPARSAAEPIAETIRDLTSHPWAGSEVELSLSALDEAEQRGVSPARRITLPQRPFSKPLARAVVEQRRDLALDARNQVRVLNVFDALMLAPEVFDVSTQHYLGLQFAYAQLAKAKTDDELRDLLPLLWDLALTIEDGDLSMAERALRDAQQALKDALENGASDEDIAKLTEQLREALQNYMRALAEQMRNNPQAMQQPFSQQQQMLSQQDLNEMLNRIEELAKTGAKDAARELLSQMQQMLENLQAGRPQMRQNQQAGEMMQSLDELSDLIQRQQRLMDETNELNRQQRQQNGQSGENGQMSEEQMAEMLQQLQEQQGALADQLQELMEKLQEQGLGESQELGQAGQEMGKAQGSLGRGEGGQAVGEQSNALDALRRGAQGMAEEMMGGQQNGTGLARGQPPQDEDPLGRPRQAQRPDFGNRVKVPDEIDVQRARRILEELRRRFSDPSRRSLELDYLDRLLENF